MDISTKVLGLELKSPIIAGSCALTGNIDDVLRIEDAGAGAIIVKPVFEEEIIYDIKKNTHIVAPVENYGESYHFVAAHAVQDYLEQHFEFIRKAKERVSIPLIGNINCYTHENWITYARNFEEAGCSAIELTMDLFPYETSLSCDDVERVYGDIIRTMRKVTTLPISIKVNKQFTDMAKFMQQLSWMGIQGLSLFSRPILLDIDIEKEELAESPIFSSPSDMYETLHWVAILSQKLKCPISAATGVHTAEDAIKMILAGADSIQVVSSLYKNGIGQITKMNDGIKRWMEQKGYEKLGDFKGKLSIKSNANTSMQLRTKYIEHALNNDPQTNN